LWCSCITDLYDFFFERAWGGTLVLPLSANLSTSGHARRSYVTALHIFLLKRACKTLLRYRSLRIYPRAGMQEPLTLPLFTYFYSSGHVRLSCVTALHIFLLKRACENLSRYRSSRIFTPVGIQDSLALPFAVIFRASR
jgi:hypothetical protein